MVRNTVLLQATKVEKEGASISIDALSTDCCPYLPTAAPTYPPRVPRSWADSFMKTTRHIELPCHKRVVVTKERGLENVDRANALAADPSQILASVAELQ
eukprot:GHVN01098655.1.p2 GENE.GHVN01098655.1~~GHVN01098655.1.p2  ORF type:complete len:100 (-),score=5.07 GHVN01098655.1:43-342(-)